MTPIVKPGDVLAGKYKVEKVLGQGGMGVVVRARHEQLGFPVAMKFMLPSALENPVAKDRFLREAQAAGRLRGENVARVMDFGTLDTGSPYIVMEFLEGQDLDQLLATRGRLPVAEAVEYLLQACSALGEAHAQEIVHRDIKPQNIFLTKKPDGSPLVKVLDFGISKLTDADSAALSVTSTAMVMGSPLYMSPEQIKSAKHVDARSDVYSLGIVLYQLVSGMHPFNATSAPELFAMVLMGNPAPLHAALPGVNPTFEAVVMRAIAREKEHRVQSTDELARLLQPFRDPSAAVGTLQQSASRMPVFDDRTVRLQPQQIVMRVPGTSAGLGATTLGRAAGSVAVEPPRAQPNPLAFALIAVLSLVVGLVTFTVVWKHRVSSATQPVSSAIAPDKSASAADPTAALPRADSSASADAVAADTVASASPAGASGAPVVASPSAVPVGPPRVNRPWPPPSGPAPSTKASAKPVKPGGDPFATPD